MRCWPVNERVEAPPERVITMTDGPNGNLEPHPCNASAPGQNRPGPGGEQNGSGTGEPLATAKPPRRDSNGQEDNPADALSDRVSVLPRSILRTVDRIRQDLDPKAEGSRWSKTSAVLKRKPPLRLSSCCCLIIVPLLTQQFTKNYLVGPIVDRIRGGEETEVFLNIEMEEDALHELPAV